MITHYLQKANETLNDLIATTSKDIEDIREARHEPIFERSKIKEQLVKSFEGTKSVIDNEIGRLAKRHPGKDLGDLLDKEQQALLGEMRSKLEQLRSENKRFATLVISVSEFYNTLLSRLVPTAKEPTGYGSVAPGRRNAFLQVQG